MNDMSIRITAVRAASCSACQYGNQFCRPHESRSTRRFDARWGIPVGALPTADVAEVGPVLRQAAVEVVRA